MLADQFEAPALLKTGGEGSMDQTGNAEKKKMLGEIWGEI